MAEERIGDYIIHPAAALFPLLEETDFEALKSSIEQHGQLLPILIQGQTLLDGRNRLRACIELNIPPKLKEYEGRLTPAELIGDLNLTRRDLEPAERATITMKIFVMARNERNALIQKVAGARGVEGGRGHKKTPSQDSGKGFKPDYAEVHARSTVGQVAKKANVSRYVAEQAAAVVTHAPELVDKILRHEISLRDAAKSVRSKAPANPRKRTEPAFLDTKTRLLSKIRKVLQQFPRQREQLQQSILEIFKCKEN
jgi:hypothetical protein